MKWKKQRIDQSSFPSREGVSHKSEFLEVSNKHVDDGGQSQHCTWISNNIFAGSAVIALIALKAITLSWGDREGFPVE